MTVAFLSLGSNVEPEKNILEAIKLLSKHAEILKSSTVYLTEPLLHKPQPKYYNCVVKIETVIEPRKLKFDILRAIEDELGRNRTEDKYAARTIDIDILLYGDLRLSAEDLVIPDPEIENRAFLALGLYEVEPGLILPATNRPIKEIADKYRNQKIRKLRKYTETLQNFIESLSV